MCGENFVEMKKLIDDSWTRLNCYRENISLSYAARETGNTDVEKYVEKFL